MVPMADNAALVHDSNPVCDAAEPNLWVTITAVLSVAISANLR